jgi:hypothetical protein
MKVVATCSLFPEEIVLNGKKIESIPSNEVDWKKWVYSSLNIEYPKFHKMDSLAKLAFLGISVLEKEIDFSTYKDEEVGLIFANKYSSYYSDNKHFINYTQKNMVSPSDFVYTLPNILTGEIAIFKKWYGDNVFFILKKFDIEFFIEQAEFMFSKSIKACLCGWIESNENGEQAYLFLIENKEGIVLKDEILEELIIDKIN